jgi:branched-chain amino acid transport system substrate-binding protein
VLLAAVAVGATILGTTQDDAEAGTASAAALDPGSGKVMKTVALGSAPSSVAVGEGSVWVLDADDRTISQIDPETREEVRTFGTATTPTDIAAGAGAVWVGNGSQSNLPVSVSRLDPATGLEVAHIELRRPPGGQLFGAHAGLSRQHIAVTHDAVWVINPDQSVSRIDTDSNRVVAVVKDVRAENIAAGDGRVWVTEGNSLAEIDQSRNVVARRIAVGDNVLAEIAVGAGAVWAAEPFGGRIWRVTPDPKVMKRAIEVDMWVAGLTFGEGAVWATNEIADLVYRIDPRTNRVRVVRGVAAPRGLGASDGAIWVAASRPPSRDAALPEPVCSGVAFDGPGRPDVLLVSDLPLRGPSRATQQAMVDAFRLVLAQRGYEAGGLSVGYQSCDDMTAQSGSEPDFFRCGSNAKAYARNLRVVGVFGSYTSFCSWLQIPITNAAPEGPLVMISPSNTADELTEDESFYPTGTRNYVRLAAASRYQAPAQVELAKQLGSRRTFLLVSALDEYGTGYVPGLRAAARSRGLPVTGSATFDPEADSFTRLVRKVAGARPDAVIVVGEPHPGSVQLIRELRTALGRGVPVVAPDAFALDDFIRLGGSAVEGMYVTQSGVPNSHLPPPGKQLLEDVADARNGDAGPDYAASYGAQAAEILLDAIARSDGTRASVMREVRRTKVVDGILGDVSFDRNGDLVEGPITVLRVAKGKFVVDRVVRVARPPARS